MKALAGLLLIASFGSPLFADDTPAWLREFARAQLPAYAPDVPAVVLLQETHFVVSTDGTVVKTARKAVKTLTESGWTQAGLREIYVTGTSKVRSLRGWGILPNGKGVKLGPEAVFDRMHAGDSDLYQDVRERGLSSPQAPPGSVIGFESVTEGRALFSQFEGYFQDRQPVLVSRFLLTLPAGWRAAAVASNAPRMVDEAQGATHRWEMRSLPYVVQEAYSAPLESLVPRVSVGYFPPSGSTPGTQSFANWKEVARWLAGLSEAQAEPTPDITAKATELTATAKTEYDKMEAVARFVQGIHYVSIQTGVGQGGGYRPHAPGQVLARLYGDCKDKSTLLRAMLKAVGVDSFLVSLRAFDRQYVREDFVSPEQFDHAIVAIKAPPDMTAPGAAEFPGLGRLLFVDATAVNVPVGKIPVSEQGGLALINSPDAAGLVRLPVAPPDSSRQTLNTILSDEGRLTATQLNGRAWRYTFPETSEWHGGRLLMFKPPLPRFGSQQMTFRASSRTYPVVLNPASYHEVLRVRLPQGVAVDELPDPQKLEAPFGAYSASCQVRGNELIIERNLEVHLASVPAAQYGALREFFARVTTFEETPIALTRR